VGAAIGGWTPGGLNIVVPFVGLGAEPYGPAPTSPSHRRSRGTGWRIAETRGGCSRGLTLGPGNCASRLSGFHRNECPIFCTVSGARREKGRPWSSGRQPRGRAKGRSSVLRRTSCLGLRMRHSVNFPPLVDRSVRSVPTVAVYDAVVKRPEISEIVKISDRVTGSGFRAGGPLRQGSTATWRRARAPRPP
jgi:hypothetical protein